MSLTAKQEQFAQLLAKKSLALLPKAATQAQLYRVCYDVSPDTSPDTVDQSASHLAADPKIASRVAELIAAYRASMVATQAWTLDRMVGQAERHIDVALSGGFRGVSAANGALELIGRATGILDRGREAPQPVITRVVVVLNRGRDGENQPQITEASYEMLPLSPVSTSNSATEGSGDAEKEPLVTALDAEKRKEQL